MKPLKRATLKRLLNGINILRKALKRRKRKGTRPRLRGARAYSSAVLEATLDATGHRIPLMRGEARAELDRRARRNIR